MGITSLDQAYGTFPSWPETSRSKYRQSIISQLRCAFQSTNRWTRCDLVVKYSFTNIDLQGSSIIHSAISSLDQVHAQTCTIGASPRPRYTSSRNLLPASCWVAQGSLGASNLLYPGPGKQLLLKSSASATNFLLATNSLHRGQKSIQPFNLIYPLSFQHLSSDPSALRVQPHRHLHPSCPPSHSPFYALQPFNSSLLFHADISPFSSSQGRFPLGFCTIVRYST